MVAATLERQLTYLHFKCEFRQRFHSYTESTWKMRKKGAELEDCSRAHKYQSIFILFTPPTTFQLFYERSSYHNEEENGKQLSTTNNSYDRFSKAQQVFAFMRW